MLSGAIASSTRSRSSDHDSQFDWRVYRRRVVQKPLDCGTRVDERLRAVQRASNRLMCIRTLDEFFLVSEINAVNVARRIGAGIAGGGDGGASGRGAAKCDSAHRLS